MKASHLLSGIAFFVLATIRAVAIGATYTPYVLGTGTANDINSSRTVIGQIYTTNGGYVFSAFSYSGGVLVNLGTLAGDTDSGASAINDSGVIVGTSSNPNTAVRGIRYSGGVMSAINGGAPYTYASGIDDSGVIVGETGAAPVAFVNNGGVVTTLGTLGGPYSGAAAINNSGTVVGRADVTPSLTHAFRYAGGVMTDLGGLFSAGNPSYAWDINDAGIIVGDSIVNGYSRAFRYNASVMTALPTPNVFHSTAEAINSAGLIVGSYTAPSPFRDHAALWDGDTLIDLAPYLDQIGLTGWNSRAMGINDNGDIVGDAWDVHYNHRAFLLAVPEPSPMLLLIVGLAVLGQAVRAR
ncbi:MAG: hypothetical protein HOP33_16175 [Verrucomicrobia bacterium]|nr:hypothetical protein [Verrucomicrobiota bacterium]